MRALAPVTLFRGTALTGGDGRLHSLGGTPAVSQLVLAGRSNPIIVDSGTLSIDSITDGTATVGWNKSGAGAVLLTGANTYHGQTSINAGAVNAQNSAAFGSGPIAVAPGATLGLTPLSGDPNPNVGDVNVNNAIMLGGTISGTPGTVNFAKPPQFRLPIISGPITLTGSSNLDAPLTDTSLGGDLFVNSTITDNGAGFSITKTGTGVVVLNGPITTSGGFAIAQGVLRTTVALPPAGPTLVLNGATLDLQNNVSINAPLELTGRGYLPTGSQLQPIGALLSSANDNTWAGPITLQQASSVGAAAGASLTLSGPVTGAFALTKVGGGTLILTNANNSFTSLNVTQGAVSLLSGAAVPASAPITVTAGAGLRLSGNSAFTGTLNLNGSGPSFGALDNQSDSNSWSGPITLQSDSTISVTAGQLTISGGIVGGSNLTKTGPGELVLTGTNGSQNTLINQGVLTLASSAALGDGTTATISAGTTLAIHGNISSSATGAARLNGQGSTGQGALFNEAGNNAFGGPVILATASSIGTAAGTSLTISNQVSDDTTPQPLLKVGAGTLVLTGANAYRGGTMVNAGTLSINSDSALGDPAGQVTLSTLGNLLVSAGTTTARTFNLNSGSIQAASGVTLSYNGATVSGGFLRGPGTHAIVGPASFSGVTALADSNIVQGAPTTLSNFINSGAFANNAPLTWNGGSNTGTGSLSVSSTLNAAAFENEGALTINTTGVLTNNGSALVSTAGSNLNVKAGGTLDVSANSLDLNGAVLVNNGTIKGTTNVNSGSVAEGAGTYGQVNVTSGGTFHPGNSPGTATSSGVNLGPGGRYQFDVNNATGTGGTNWSLWNVDGPLTVSAGNTSNSRFTISINSLDANGAPAVAAGFLPGGTYAWNIATYQSIAGWSPGEFTIDASGLAGRSTQSMLALKSDGQRVTLTYEGLPGDTNNDGAVGFDDLLTLAQHYGQQGVGIGDGDFNFDGTVGFDDLLTLAQNYGRAPTVAEVAVLPPGAAADVAAAFAQVPEPAAAGLLFAAAALSRRKFMPSRSETSSC